MMPQILDGLVNLCLDAGERLNEPAAASPKERAAFLLALCGRETIWGTIWKQTLFEPAYYWKGEYARRDQLELLKMWGAAAAMSYGPTQMLPLRAWEAGWRAELPYELALPEVNLDWCVKAFNEDCFQKVVEREGSFVRVKRELPMTWDTVAAWWNGGPATFAQGPVDWNNRVRAYVGDVVGVKLPEARRILKLNHAPAVTA